MARPRKRSTTIKNDPFGDHPYASVIPSAAAWDDARVHPDDPAEEAVAEEAPPAARVSPHAPTGPTPGRGRRAPAPPAPLPPAARTRHKLTVHLDGDLVNRVKNAAYWNPRLTIARIAERGIRKALDEVERENGGPYQQRETELIGGRPIK